MYLTQAQANNLIPQNQQTVQPKQEAKSQIPSSSITTETSKASAATSGESAISSKIDALAKKIAPYPEALDLLIYIFETILKYPKEEKYRSVKTTKPSYVSAIGPCSKAAEDILLLAGFRKSGEYLSLSSSKQRGEESLLWIAKTSLESQRETDVYKNNKDRLLLLKVMAESKASASAEEMERRNELRKKVPMEPEEGAAGTTRITVFIGDAVLKRRFTSDDTLNQVVNWIGASYSSYMPLKLTQSKSCELVDVTLFPHKTVNVKDDGNRTLQALGFWPGAELRVKVRDMEGN